MWSLVIDPYHINYISIVIALGWIPKSKWYSDQDSSSKQSVAVLAQFCLAPECFVLNYMCGRWVAPTTGHTLDSRIGAP